MVVWMVVEKVVAMDDGTDKQKGKKAVEQMAEMMVAS